jgi:hypothetical protein
MKELYRIINTMVRSYKFHIVPFVATMSWPPSWSIQTSRGASVAMRDTPTRRLLKTFQRLSWVDCGASSSEAKLDFKVGPGKTTSVNPAPLVGAPGRSHKPCQPGNPLYLGMILK